MSTKTASSYFLGVTILLNNCRSISKQNENWRKSDQQTFMADVLLKYVDYQLIYKLFIKERQN